MEPMTKIEAVNRMVGAFKALVVAKEDCDTVIDATIDAYSQGDQTATKEDLKAMVDLAKKIVADKHQEAAKAARALAGLAEEIGF